MTKIASLQAIAAALLAYGLAAAPAQAGPNRTFVSGTGTDSSSCSRTAPCRTFAFALTQTAAGGEIDVLNTAGYGPVTIIHAISIVNDGVGTVGITAGSGNAITINAGGSDSVHLRGLNLTGLGTGTNGILFNSGGNLVIENCVVRGFTNAGIDIAPFDANSAVLSKVTAINNNVGILVDASFASSLIAIIMDSEASNNISAGVRASGAAGFLSASVIVRNVVASGNFIGLQTGFAGIIRVAHSVVTGNSSGVDNGGVGVIFSYGDNDIDGNTFDNTGLLTPLSMH